MKANPPASIVLNAMLISVALLSVPKFTPRISFSMGRFGMRKKYATRPNATIISPVIMTVHACLSRTVRRAPDEPIRDASTLSLLAVCALFLFASSISGIFFTLWRSIFDSQSSQPTLRANKGLLLRLDFDCQVLGEPSLFCTNLAGS